MIRDEAGFAAMLGMKKGDRVAQANGIALRAPDDVIDRGAASAGGQSAGAARRASRGNEPRELMLLNASACPG